MKNFNRTLGRLLLTCMLVLCLIVPSFGQKGSFGRSGSSSSFSSSRSSSSSSGSFGRSSSSPSSGSFGRSSSSFGRQPAANTGSGSFGRSGNSGSFGRQTTTNTSSGSFGRQPAANTSSGSFGRSNSSGSFGRSSGSTSSGWSRPTYRTPTYHVGLSYHMTTMPSNRIQIWVGGRPSWYYPDYGYVAYQSNPYAFVGAYDPNGSYGPPANYGGGGPVYAGPGVPWGLIFGFLIIAVILIALFRPRGRTF